MTEGLEPDGEDVRRSQRRERKIKMHHHERASRKVRVTLVSSTRISRRKLPGRSESAGGIIKAKSSIANQNELFLNNKGIDVDEVEFDERESLKSEDDNDNTPRMLKDIDKEAIKSCSKLEEDADEVDSQRSVAKKSISNLSSESGTTMNTENIMGERDQSSK